MDTEFYKKKILLVLSESPKKALKKYQLNRAAMNHITQQEQTMLLNFMEESELITTHIARRMRGAGSPATIVTITETGEETLKQLKKEAVSG